MIEYSIRSRDPGAGFARAEFAERTARQTAQAASAEGHTHPNHRAKYVGPRPGCGPGDGRAQIVTDDHRRRLSQRIDHAGAGRDEFSDTIGVGVGRLRRSAVARHVYGNDPIAGSSQSLELISPGIPGLGKAVAQQNHRAGRPGKPEMYALPACADGLLLPVGADHDSSSLGALCLRPKCRVPRGTLSASSATLESAASSQSPILRTSQYRALLHVTLGGVVAPTPAYSPA
jgi:hypothetical protein